MDISPWKQSDYRLEANNFEMGREEEGGGKGRRTRVAISRLFFAEHPDRCIDKLQRGEREREERREKREERERERERERGD